MNATQLLAHFDRLAEAPNAVPRLRRFILDLAVRGKLVEQDVGDEPATELLKRIHAERLRILNKPVKGSVALATEFDSTDIELPEGWAWSRLGSLCTKTGSGSTPSGGKDAYVSSGVPFLRSQNVYDEGLRLDGVAFISESTQERMSSTTVKPGDLLLNITGGSIGRCAIVPDSFFIGNISQHVAIIRLALLESGRFLHSVICSDYFQKHIFGNQTGAGREGLPKNRMDEILIPVAPLAEQHRIVAKVDELMTLCDQLEAAQQERERRRDRLAAASLQRLNQPAADTPPEVQREHARFHLHHLPRLTTRPEHIKAMRQTILNLAVRGLLHKNEGLGLPKSVALKPDVQSAAGVDSPVFSEALALMSVPSHWGIFPLASVSEEIVDCPHSTPVWAQSGKICVRTSQFRPGFLDLSNVRFVSQATYSDRILRLVPRENDILYSREGGILGVACRVPAHVELCLGQRMMLIRAGKTVAPIFLELILNSPLITEIARGRTTGGAAPRVNVATVKAYPIPVPPLAEQHRIVAKVDELMVLCDQLEAQLTTTQTDSRRLLEAVLETTLTPA